MEVVSGLFQEQGRTRRYMSFTSKLCVCVRDYDLGNVFS